MALRPGTLHQKDIMYAAFLPACIPQELQERMRFVKERAAASVSASASGSGKDAGAELYENMCMKVREVRLVEYPC